jgi:mRNA interferase YafQ
MREPSYSSRFRQDTKRVNKRNYPMQKQALAMTLLENSIPLPARYREHPLHGNWEGYLECHLEPDWLLIYLIDDDADPHTVYFARTGTHQDVFGW